jgi:nucleotide sugar dehydrogenase
MKVGIFGLGVVGTAIKESLVNAGHEVVSYDPKLGEFNGAQFAECYFVFVSVPTPTDKDGYQDRSALMDVCSKLKSIEYKRPVILKSTVLPGTCTYLRSLYGTFFIHCPEFLTERNAKSDYINQKEIIYSMPKGHSQIQYEFEKLMRETTNKDVKITSSNSYRETELAKYLHNNFLASKVAFMNEFYDICKNQEVEYSIVIKLALTQGKVGDTHTLVPGPDGKRGFGGMCFLKDTKALSTFCMKNDIRTPILDAVIDYNNTVR